MMGIKFCSSGCRPFTHYLFLCHCVFCWNKWHQAVYLFITPITCACQPCLESRYCFKRSLCVCLTVRTQTEKLLIRN